MNLSAPDPRYWRDGSGLRPRWTWRWLRHPRRFFWFVQPRCLLKLRVRRKDRLARNDQTQASHDVVDLGWHVIHGERLLSLLFRARAGEHPDSLYIEEWANAKHEESE